jgi:hypothetical protein
MPRILWPCILAVVASCDSGPQPPAVLQQTELKARILVETADPVDPASVLFTLHKAGQVTWKGCLQTSGEMVRRTGGEGSINTKPILLEVDPDASFSVVRDALAVLTGSPQCVNYSFLVDSRSGPGTVVLPLQAAKGMGYHVYDRDKEVHVGKYPDGQQLEIVVSPGKGGEINVREINYVVPGTIAFPSSEAGASWKEKTAWKGDHLPFGNWTKDMLRTFLSRADVVERLPYIHFKVTNEEIVSDVVRCLAVMRTLNVPIVPSIPTRP